MQHGEYAAEYGGHLMQHRRQYPPWAALGQTRSEPI
jgi:hypothetical protein